MRPPQHLPPSPPLDDDTGGGRLQYSLLTNVCGGDRTPGLRARLRQVGKIVAKIAEAAPGAALLIQK
jgi:hypothetical protein